MSDATLRIKNLSIALEALSHVTGSNHIKHFNRIEELLEDEILGLEKEKEKENQWPNRPARTATTNTDYDLFNPSKL